METRQMYAVAGLVIAIALILIGIVGLWLVPPAAGNIDFSILGATLKSNVIGFAVILVGVVLFIASFNLAPSAELDTGLNATQKNAPQQDGSAHRWEAIIIILIVAGLVLSGAFIFLVHGPAPTPTSTSPPVEALSIMSPSANSSQGYAVNVSGTWQNVPSNQSLWLVVRARTVNLFYPQLGPITLLYTQGDKPVGTWSGLAYLGQPTVGVNETYDIIAVLANSTANTTFSNYLTHGAASQNYPGLNRLPAGTQEWSPVAVTRTK